MVFNSNKYFQIAKDTSFKAGDYLKRNFGNIKGFTHKKEFHYGIHEDIVANDIYEKLLKKLTPEAGLYTEEGEKNLSNDLVWIIDPLEGTSNYRVGNPFWATQICLIENGNPVVSVVYAPILDLFYYAIKNDGAYLNNKKINISSTQKTDMALISIGKGIKDEHRLWYSDVLYKVIKNVRTFRHFGACGLELAMTASGMIDAYINKGSNIYDYVSGALLVKEAGGVVTDFNGNDWNIKKDEILASNKALNKLLIKII